MQCPTTIQDWLRESIACYNQSLRDRVSLYENDKAMFFFRQYEFASDYAFRSRGQEAEEDAAVRVNVQVRHWFATMPDTYDEIANEPGFAFAFCYSFSDK
jgi:hypothetical protein